MRLSTALQDLVTLERVREYAEQGPGTFDRDGFVGGVDVNTPVTDLIKAPPARPIIPETMRFSASGLKKFQDCPPPVQVLVCP
jgi:hypothetical protein